MKQEEKDESYLDKLLDSVTNNTEDEIDKKIENETENIENTFDINQDENSNETKETQNENKDSFENLLDSDIMNQDEIDSDKTNQSENNMDTANVENISDKNDDESINNAVDNEISAKENKEEPLHNNLDLSDTMSDISDISDIMKELDSLETTSLEEEPAYVKNDSSSRYEEELETKEKNTNEKLKQNEEIENTANQEKKEKKPGFLKKLFSRKKDKQSSEPSLIDADRVLLETGSVMDDLDNLALGDLGLGDTDSFDTSLDEYGDVLDSIKDKSEKKKEKKKEKKEKEKKEKKPKEKKKKEKKKKEKKPVSKEELIKITPLGIILPGTIIIALIFTIYFGAQQFNYNQNIDDATNYYVDKDYTKAYDLISGMNLKKADKDFYKQVTNIMKVEKYNNEFHTFYQSRKYAQALDSLIRGIKKFDEVVNESRDIGTFDQTTACFDKIKQNLNDYYGLSETDARQIANITDSNQYTEKIGEYSSSVNKIQEGTEKE